MDFFFRLNSTNVLTDASIFLSTCTSLTSSQVDVVAVDVEVVVDAAEEAVVDHVTMTPGAVIGLSP